ncbi:hypothetical protein PVAND_017062 [Polypedilum vanderplanki]|uniref:Carboxylic ester hydrolase n=1 Tax=Polypedilum vanderplanki TaxID=319348 RepID=A0A9J6BHX6_POLVA|nr:hypothetical protein PVAND_017062 [Polypedilum vanderplanki]
MDNIEIVNTEYGKVKGIYKISALGTDYVSFQGIPYMKAPLGKLRFKDAQVPEKWDHILDATEDSPSYCAFNLITREKEGQENAGTICVYTKNVKPEKFYPVLIWIHGGSFMRGSCKTDVYGPDYFMEKDIILVTLNYRLGAIGFLSLDDESLNVPGNAGLKDQLFALKFIKRNIENFGGDSNNITLFGESAGGQSVHLLSISEQSKGLFNRAIIMSGTAFNKSWCFKMPRKMCRKFNDKLARKLGWNGKFGDEKSLLEFLENASACEIVDETNLILSNEDEFEHGILLPFGPIIEPYKSKNCLIFKDPIEMARDSWSNEIDIIFSGTSFEGIFKANVKDEVAFYYLQDPAYFTPLIDLDLQVTDPITQEYGQRIKNLYYQPDEMPSIENQEAYLRYCSDFIFWHGIYRAVQSRLEFSKAKTFLLRFNVDGKLNLYKSLKKSEKYKGACHADDLFYLFKTIHLDVPEKDSNEFKSIERMIGIFTNFAATGDPNYDDCKFSPQSNINDLKCTEITEKDVKEIDLPELKTLKVWDSIYKDHDVPLF